MFLLFVEAEDFESSLLSFEKLDRASPDLWPEKCKFYIIMLKNIFFKLISFTKCVIDIVHPYTVFSYLILHCFLCFLETVPGVSEFAASFKNVSIVHTCSLS